LICPHLSCRRSFQKRCLVDVFINLLLFTVVIILVSMALVNTTNFASCYYCYIVAAVFLLFMTIIPSIINFVIILIFIPWSLFLNLDAVSVYAYEFTQSYAYAYILMCVNFDTG
jgi:hypothetical protein